MHQEEVCQTLGFAVRSLTRWENGQSEPGLEKAARLAEHYGVSLDWISGRTTLRSVVRPGTVLVDNAVVAALERMVTDGKTQEDVRPFLRNPGLDYVFEVPEDATVLESRAARTLDIRVRTLFKQLPRKKR